jgi:MarR family transcriptional regulator for hemolysin
MVDRLEAAGMLERRADASDRRIWRLHLLPAAEPILKKMTLMSAELEAALTHDLSPAAREAIIAGLIQIKTNLLHKPETHSRNAADLDGAPTGSAPTQSAMVTDQLKEIA